MRYCEGAALALQGSGRRGASPALQRQGTAEASRRFGNWAVWKRWTQTSGTHMYSCKRDADDFRRDTA